jgi:PPOX class probable F420-dependent enzyme
MNLEQFQKQQYLNLETFRKSGQGVKTPVWFAQDGDLLHVWTQADSGKAKRIRNNGTVNIAPCTASGELLGGWIPARAQADGSASALAHVEDLFRKKYGMIFSLLYFFRRVLGKAQYTAIEIHAL